ncbi:MULTISPECIES: STAS domain-containing protein [Streptomyces]|jgi:anti-anti-sigma factor|uniref:STAS domain-containing protein n=1 Tax=Streptomyces spinosisporus TaxID=2927582 RepID=A0ABS9XGY7_9ACTN|nr:MULTISPECIES: STAS domain-containing protein [Streptomyces]MCI3240621.1 STAS domain-containing protein [Streptomyces spinosisporus]WUB37220.1 STAS domain-containing protein [Streptomyces sp. NBC_00588]
MTDSSPPGSPPAADGIRKVCGRVLRSLRRTVRTSGDADRVVVRISGEITAANAELVGEKLRKAVASDPQVLEIDLRRVSRLDSGGGRAFLMALHAVRLRRTRLIVTHVGTQARGTLELLGIARSLGLEDGGTADRW